MSENLKIIEEKKNDLFKRKEIIAEVHSLKIPSKEEILEMVAKKFSADKNTIVVERVRGKFGVSAFKFFAKVYSSEQEKDKIERKSKKDKKTEAPAQEAQ